MTSSYKRYFNPTLLGYPTSDSRLFCPSKPIDMHFLILLVATSRHCSWSCVTVATWCGGAHKITTSILNLRLNTSWSFCAEVMVMESTSSEWSDTCELIQREHDLTFRYFLTKLSFTGLEPQSNRSQDPGNQSTAVFCLDQLHPKGMALFCRGLPRTSAARIRFEQRSVCRTPAPKLESQMEVSWNGGTPKMDGL